ncbi:MAG: type II toxin-antitoxin system mRNA interferase toxin, RelE/StbE family [Patescibacteria group bacterium]
MLAIAYTPTFARMFKRLEKDLQEEAIEKIELFKNIKNHQVLRVHKLHGRFSSNYSFSINYQTRVVFQYLSKKEVVCVAIGDHEVYR